MDPAEVTQEYADAFNAHDLERLVACYSPNAVVQDEAGNVIAQGEEAIRAVHSQIVAQSPDLHVEILNRIHVGSWVAEEEQATGFYLEGSGIPPEFHVINVYRVEDGKIVKYIASLS